MKRFLILLSLAISLPNLYANTVIDIINAQLHGQIYCKSLTPLNSVTYIKTRTENLVNYCSNEYIEGQYKSDFEQLEKLAAKYPDKYSGYMGYAIMMQLGNQQDWNKIVPWFEKGVKANNTIAKFGLAEMYFSNEVKGCSFDDSICINKGTTLLKSINNGKSNFLISAYSSNIKTKCEYAEKALDKGNLNTYPLYLSACVLNDDTEQLNGSQTKKLMSVIDSKDTSISAKTDAAKLLKIMSDNKNQEYNRVYDLLSSVQY